MSIRETQQNGKMHSANLATSKRLQRLLSVLSDGKDHTTLDIIQTANICAVNSAVAELRDNGFRVDCRKVSGNRYLYRLRVAL